jgi:hypothetical protein
LLQVLRHQLADCTFKALGPTTLLECPLCLQPSPQGLVLGWLLLGHGLAVSPSPWSELFRSYTFLYVPKHPPRNPRKLCHKVIRSYTFRSTRLAILANCVTKSYVPIRSGTPLSQFSQTVSQSYTFLYVRSTFQRRSCW